METEAFRAIVNIKEINDRGTHSSRSLSWYDLGKPLMNITSRVRFNDAIFTSQVNIQWENPQIIALIRKSLTPIACRSHSDKIFSLFVRELTSINPLSFYLKKKVDCLFEETSSKFLASGRKFGELAIRVGDQQISSRFEVELLTIQKRKINCLWNRQKNGSKWSPAFLLLDWLSSFICCCLELVLIRA